MNDRQRAWEWAKKEGIIPENQQNYKMWLDEYIYIRWRTEQKNLNPK